MATRRRDVAPRKDEIGQSPSRTPNRTIATSNAPPKTHDPKKHITTSLRPAIRSSTNDVHKQLIKKPTSIDSAHKPTQATRRTLDKNPLPAQKPRVPINPSLQPHETTPLSKQKTRVSTATSLPSRGKTPLPAQKTKVSTSPSLQFRDKTAPPAHKTSVLTNRSLRPHDKTPLPARKTQASLSPFPGKTTACQKTVKDDEGHSLHETPVGTTLKMSSACSGQETEIITTSTKTEQTDYTFQENDENLNIYQNLPEVETLLEDQELVSFFLQQEIQTVENVEHNMLKVASDGEDSITDLALEGDQEKPLDIVGIEAEKHDDDGAKIVTLIEPSPAPPDVRTQESEEKLFVEEKLEEHTSVQEIVDNTNNINKSVANDYHKEEDEEKVEVAGQSEVHESGETKEPEVVERHNHESENKAHKQGGPMLKKDSVVSNNTIEETATKLRDQRINRVRALAGAFESVMQ